MLLNSRTAPDVNPAVATVKQVLQNKLAFLLRSENSRCIFNRTHGYTRPNWVYPISNLCKLVFAISLWSTELAHTFANLCITNHIQYVMPFDSVRYHVRILENV